VWDTYRILAKYPTRVPMVERLVAIVYKCRLIFVSSSSSELTMRIGGAGVHLMATTIVAIQSLMVMVAAAKLTACLMALSNLQSTSVTRAFNARTLNFSFHVATQKLFLYCLHCSSD
jgi:hypothetical protein